MPTLAVIMTLCLRHQVEAENQALITKSPCIRFDLEKLKEPKTAAVFQSKVRGKFSALCFLHSDVDTLANSQKERADLNGSRGPWETEEGDSFLVKNEVLDLCGQSLLVS